MGGVSLTGVGKIEAIEAVSLSQLGVALGSSACIIKMVWNNSSCSIRRPQRLHTLTGDHR
jgi:hypothetical protein